MIIKNKRGHDRRLIPLRQGALLISNASSNVQTQTHSFYTRVLSYSLFNLKIIKKKNRQNRKALQFPLPFCYIVFISVKNKKRMGEIGLEHATNSVDFCQPAVPLYAGLRISGRCPPHVVKQLFYYHFFFFLSLLTFLLVLLIHK